MFGMFNNKAERNAKKYPLSRDAGEHGTPENAYVAAQRDGGGGWTSKKELLAGCVAAFEAGRPQNLRSFVTGYLEFKRANGSVSKMETEGIDDGFVGLLCDPIMLLLEKQKEPAAVLETLTREMSPYYKQILLDLVLRRCAMTNSWMVMPVIIAAGADVNAGRGRALSNTGRRGFVQLTRILLDAGADIGMARALLEAENKQDALDAFIKTIAAAKGTTPAPDVSAQEGAADEPPAKLVITTRTPIKKPAAE